MKHIAFTIDKNFVRFCGVTMVSAMHNDNPSDLHFHIVSEGLPAADAETLRSLAEKKGSEISFHTVSPEALNGYEVRWEGKRLTKVVFFRCLLPSLLPADVEKVIYMDCDMLVLQPLDNLWNTSLDNLALAAAPDSLEPNPQHPQRLEYDESFGYFNGGMLLLNLKYWRENNLEEKCKEYYNKYPERILMNDQDLLNGLLHASKKFVDIAYNLQEGAYRLPAGKPADWQPPYIDMLLRPAILHYSSRKPWQYHCMHPLRHLFFEYQNMTPWAGEHPLNTFGARLHRFIHLLPYTLGVKRSKYIRLQGGY